MPSNQKKINILIVEDNLVVQEYLKSALKNDEQNVIIDIVDNGNTAVEQAIAKKPDIILMDLFLPELDGIEVIQRVMYKAPCPIVVISGELNRKDRDLTFEAQRAGAVDVLSKPFGMDFDNFTEFSNKLCRTVKTMSQVKVTRRWFYQKYKTDSPEYDISALNDSHLKETIVHPTIDLKNGLLLIGSSTGGPSALYEILNQLPNEFPFSILIAQHISEGFSANLASWLSKTGCNVCIPKDGDVLENSKVYLSDDARHLVLGRNRKLHQVMDTRQRFSPSVDLLFESVDEHFHGKICAIILTGMGDDGTQGIEKLHRSGAFTIAEAESSCVVFGMPKMAINAGAIKSVLPLDDICDVLARSAILT